MIQDDFNQFQRISKKLIEAEIKEAVVAPIKAEKLYDVLDLSLEEEGISDDQFYQVLEELVMHTPRTASKQFFNQLFGGRKGKASLGDLIAVMLNNSMYTYKVAGPMVGVEKEIIHQVCRLIGYGKESNGTIAPGGSMSNYMAMVMARDQKVEDIRSSGVDRKMTLYTSIDCHYSIAKNSALMGIGRDQVRFIETDSYGCMIPEKLEESISKDLNDGFTPFFVNATAGTTVLGAFDPIGPLSEICSKFDLWLHVDGAYCGSVIFSNRYKFLVESCEKADSFSFNAHKMIGTPLTCSLILVKDKKHLYNSFSNDASYLYQTDGDDFNLGKTSLQCGRRNDALKFWCLWKSMGTKGLSDLVDHQFYLADIARDYIKKNSDYTLYSFDNSISVCFNYKNIPAQKLCTALYEEAKLMVGFGHFRQEEFVRFVTINSDNSAEDILNFFHVLEQFVEDKQELLLSEALMDS